MRNIARETNISTSEAHRIMRDVIVSKTYMMHRTQQLLDKDMNLRIEMCELN